VAPLKAAATAAIETEKQAGREILDRLRERPGGRYRNRLGHPTGWTGGSTPRFLEWLIKAIATLPEAGPGGRDGSGGGQCHGVDRAEQDRHERADSPRRLVVIRLFAFRIDPAVDRRVGTAWATFARQQQLARAIFVRS